ncbi:aklanonic acid methyltransferase DnrC [Clostridium homopropionicum DSM 5847]|uniref:Aklanonic acid methyltransferase DnrC n=1 Tax=Clostridium homopropionicum DSM 5847 TaxID=1121318 RepID=A0A0L6Z7S3_9CLOT|nr:class I SAM-dependent methyltransferase [Clostridium homopropionicum]KOA18843.1 aklanonic acid methyltransferase DnrC [Clostridium homopropionicum DSM 5847]SFG90052.1 ubiE/COQ5 methyltransferase family protein [Clostridium homopropionicum]
MSDKKSEIMNVWDKVASNFGKVGPKYWNYFGKRLVELSSIKQGAKVLDIGMGRGASLFPAVNMVGLDGYVIGIDSSEAIVTETHKDILSRNILNAEVKCMNAVKLNFDNNYFDNVICGFGFGYLLLSESKLNDIRRILKNNGQVAFSIWGQQEDQKWLTEIINKYLQIENKNNEENPEIPKLDTVDDVTKILNDAGFHNIKVHEENSVVVYKEKEEWWQEMCSNAVRSIFDQIEALGSRTFIEFKNEVFNGLQKYYKEAGICFNMPVIYALGEK